MSTSAPTIDDAQTTMNATCIALAIATAWVYELFNAIPEEVRMLSDISLVMADITYISARLTSATCVLTVIVLGFNFPNDSIPLSLCRGLLTVNAWTCAFAVPFSSFLFLLRIRAVYHDSRMVSLSFAILWASSFLSFIVPMTYQAAIEMKNGWQWCWIHKVRHLGSVPFIVLAAFDTTVFIAIFYRTLSNIPEKDLKTKFKLVIFKNNISSISMSLLQSGLIYYLATVGVNIFAAAMFLSSGSGPLHTAIAIFDILFQNIMACRAVRYLKLGQNQIDRFPATIRSYEAVGQSPSPNADLPSSFHHSTQKCGVLESETGDSLITTTRWSNWSAGDTPSPLQISITKETEVVIDPASVTDAG